MKGKKMEEVSIRGLLRFMYGHLRVSYEAITDTARKQAVISKDTVANACLCATGQGARSLRETDFLSASPVIRDVIGRRVPDTTLSRVVGGFKGTSRLLIRLWRRLRAQGHLGLGGESVGIIDGTCLGGHWQSVLVEVGQTPAIVATHYYPGRGNELSTCVKMLKRLKSQVMGCFDYLLGDGLYACERFWRACDTLKCKGLVKTSDEDPLMAITQARLLFDHPVRGQAVGYQDVEGTDAARALKYRVWLTSALWANTRRRLSVARVEETHLKDGHVERFWVLCQDLTIDPHKIRQLAHARWFIENNVFKAFNDQAHSKHQFSRNPQVAENFTHLQALAFMALAAYRQHLQKSCVPDTLWDHHRIPLRLLQSRLRLVLSPAGSG